MSTGLLYQYLRVIIGGRVWEFGQRNSPVSISLNGESRCEANVLSAGTTWDFWGFTSEEPVPSFGVLAIESDIDGVQVELTCDKGSDVGRKEFVVVLSAGVPFVLSSDDSIANHTSDFATGTLDVIDRIRIRNPSGASSSATVQAGVFY